MDVKIAFLAPAAALLVACAARPLAPVVPTDPLVGTGADATPVDARALASRARFTVFVFFSPTCHCFERHQDRLRALAATYGPRGVQLIAVDPEKRATPEGDAAEAARRGLPFPILVDRGARLAGALRAEYATYSVVVDADGRVRYHGGLDSDRQHLHDDATMYVRDALDDLLADRAPRVPTAKALGCSLETW